MAKQETNQIVKTENATVKATASERFTNAVIREFKSGQGNIELSEKHKRLIQNYFIGVDLSLKKAEEKRLFKNEKYRDKVSLTWENVNMANLALDVVSCAKIGYDPALPNHINMIPYKNNSTEKYDIGFIEGYRGIELKAMKYGFDKPDHVIVKVVKKNDKFKPIMRDANNEKESYIFQIADNPFDRGEIVGGFYFHQFDKEPGKNKLVWFTVADIEKRKPKYASVEFWGGEKDVYKDGKKAGTETIEGWYEEMVYKTIYRAAYNDITIDGDLIDAEYMRVMENQLALNEHSPEKELDEDIKSNANRDNLDIDDAQIAEEPKEIEQKPKAPNTDTSESKDEQPPTPEKKESSQKPAENNTVPSSKPLF